jgi:hypothetical protein
MQDEPDLKLAGLSLWVVGPQFPGAENDYWDENWLTVRVRVEAPGSIVEVQGPILYASELEYFMNQVQLLDRTLTGDASLQCMEPNLRLAIRASEGHASVTIRLTPDHLTQVHEFTFHIDQTYFKPLIANCKKILSDYPIRGAP